MKRFVAVLLLLLALLPRLVSCAAPKTDPLPSGTEATAVILLYHHFSSDGGDNAQSAAGFARQLDALLDAGYSFVTLRDLAAFVRDGTPLPEKPVAVMADDGYQSVLDVALPVARARSIPLTAAVIGLSDGKSTYRDTGTPIIPHFRAADAAAEGLFLISHGYDGHMGALDEGSSGYRRGLLRRDGETDGDYRAYLTSDKAAMDALLAGIGDPSILAYPYGLYSEESESVLRSLGIRMTLTTEEGLCRLTVGNADCLFCLPRLTVEPGTSGTDLTARIADLWIITPP